MGVHQGGANVSIPSDPGKKKNMEVLGETAQTVSLKTFTLAKMHATTHYATAWQSSKKLARLSVNETTRFA